MYLTNKKINHGIIITSVLFIFFSGLSGFLLYNLALNKEQLIELERTERDQAFESTQAFAIRKIARETETSRNTLNTFFVRGEKETAQFLSDVEEYGILLNIAPSISVSVQSDVVSESEQDVLQLDISGSGSFENIFTYIQLLESLPYRISTPEVSVQFLGVVDNNDDPEWKVKVKILLLSYSKSL